MSKWARVGPKGEGLPKGLVNRVRFHLAIHTYLLSRKLWPKLSIIQSITAKDGPRIEMGPYGFVANCYFINSGVDAVPEQTGAWDRI